jgi:hypothetical protein
MYIPTEWGEPYFMAKGSTLAIREKELKELIIALEDIQNGKTSIEEALYNQLPNGNIATIFDIYGMEPEFLESNYQEVKLHKRSKALIKKYKKTQKSQPASLTLPSEVKASNQELDHIVNRYSFDQLDKDSVILWSGGNSIFLPQEGKIISANSEIAMAFLKVNNLLQDNIAFTDLAQALTTRHSKCSDILPPEIHEKDIFEEKAFWQKISQKFVLAAKGTIYVASNEARPTGNFRLYELDCIKENPNIVSVCDLQGTIVKPNTFPFVDLITKKFNRHASFQKWKKFVNDNGIEQNKLINSNLIYNSRLKTIPKDQWLRQKKAEWFQSSKNKILLHLKGEPLKSNTSNHDNFYYDELGLDFILCKANFISEAILALEEYKKKLSIDLLIQDNEALDLLERLNDMLDIFNKHPEILYIDEPYTDRELKRSKLAQSNTSRMDIYIAKIGEMLLSLDTSLSLSDKNNIWTEQNNLEITQMVTSKISSLKSEINKVLSGKSHILGNPYKPSTPL